MIAMIFEDKEAVAHADFSSIKSLRMGSAPVSKELLNKIESIIPQAKVMNAYGTTEGSMIVFAQHPDGKPTPFQSLGYKHPAVDLRLVDGSGAEASEGVLQVRSPALMNEYHNRPELSAPFTGDGYYETGDIFRRDADGFYFFVGRADDMFVCGGESIFPGAVERLLEGHPDVAQACVVPIDDPVKGQKPVAFVQLESNATVDAETLKTYALENGPAYSHPRSIWFLEQFPLGPTNKIDRALLKQRARELGIGR
jgi:acyl-CoA synthetase (AMP-forming)/AMP-acid ligase II